LKLAQNFELHQLTSGEYGSAPINRLRNDSLHATKATNPRAADATTATVPRSLKTAIDQLVTSHLQKQ
jgi:hypothetical protein